MKRELTFSFLFIFYFLFFSTSSSAFAQEEFKTINSFGNWTFDELGYSTIVLTGQENTESNTIKYILPLNATQGTNAWYLIHLNFSIEFNENSADGYAYVSAFTNNRSFALIKFEVKRNNNSLNITWSKRNLLGIYRNSTSSPKMNVYFTNYLQYQGVSSGINTITFKLEQYGGVIVEKLEILPDSAVEFTPLSPPKLDLEVKPLKDSVQVGDSFIISFLLKNIGNHSAQNVTVQPIYQKEEFELIGEEFYNTPSLGNSLEGNFELKAIKSGEHEVVIVTKTESGILRPSASVLVPVKDKRLSFPLLLIVGILLVLGVFIGVICYERFR